MIILHCLLVQLHHNDHQDRDSRFQRHRDHYCAHSEPTPTQTKAFCSSGNYQAELGHIISLKAMLARNLYTTHGNSVANTGQHGKRGKGVDARFHPSFDKMVRSVEMILSYIHPSQKNVDFTKMTGWIALSGLILVFLQVWDGVIYPKLARLRRRLWALQPYLIQHVFSLPSPSRFS